MALNIYLLNDQTYNKIWFHKQEVFILLAYVHANFLSIWVNTIHTFTFFISFTKKMFSLYV